MSPTKVIEIELSHPLETLTDLGHYSHVRGLVRFQGTPIGEIELPVVQGCCSAAAIAQAILPYYNWTIARDVVQRRLHQTTGSWQIEDMLELPAITPAALPSVTVAVCVRPGTDPTACLAALSQLNHPDFEVLVVEANPQTDAVRQQVLQFPSLHYGATVQSGLNAARNWAIEKAQGEIIAFTEANCIVDPNWVQQLAKSFAEHPDLMAITGWVLPAELETEAQSQFDYGYGLGRGSERIWYRLDPTQPVPWPRLGTMQLGSGVNMAYRRQVFEQLGPFDLALDWPDLTWGGGDWDMFSRVLLAGYRLLYEPAAIVRYVAPDRPEALRAKVQQDIIAFYAYLAAGMQRHPDQRLNFFRLGLWKLARLTKLLVQPGAMSRSLIQAELQGIWQSWGRYGAAQRTLSADFPRVNLVRSTAPCPAKLMAVRSIDLAQPLTDLTNIADYRAVRLFVNVGNDALGFLDIEHQYGTLSVARIRQAIATQHYLNLLAIPHRGDTGAAWTELQTAFANRWMPEPEPAALEAQLPDRLPLEIPVSVIITTCDRPDDLANCLRHLQAQKTSRPIEIIVADNRPASGLTPPVVAQFPGVKLVSEARPGGSYGRNAAITASTGEIVVSVDDDVVVPPDWLEKLLAPLARPEVMVVTGNVLPLELETPAQLMFESLKGGLGEGFKPFEVDHHWWTSFRNSPPTWDLGVSANAAFRATIFSHPEIGLMDEVLGPGTPTVGGEENHLIYKVLRAGYTLVYEPAAFVWHRHRRDLDAFYRQIYGHMKGGTAYHLLLWLQENDRRGLRQLVYELPRYYMQHLLARLKKQHQTPWRLLWSEVAGYFAGYWGYWKSCQLVKQQGRSAPYIPVADRPPTQPIATIATAQSPPDSALEIISETLSRPNS